jgi:hypothetical protein
MTLRPEYSLGHSQYNEFLFASAGVEADGEQLSVLSALSRLDLDPWREAARLADLPRDAAASSLATILSRLPDAGWKIPDPAGNAARLVAILPSGSTPEIPTTIESRARRDAPRPSDAQPIGRQARPTFKTWLFWAGLAVAAFLLFLVLQPDNNFEPPIKPFTEQR